MLVARCCLWCTHHPQGCWHRGALPLSASGHPAQQLVSGVQVMLDRGRFKDPIARGLATAGCAHGLGTAAIASECVPCCKLCAPSHACLLACLLATQIMHQDD